MATRTASVSRNTNETQIAVTVDLDCGPGSGNLQTIDISTGIGFLDHVLAAGVTLHVDVKFYLTALFTERYLRCESAFKALALAIKQAIERTGTSDIPSTKGVL
ncbi:hypothetical protein ID866_4216 [Astraeus odoratus]|nr:hypothetical protein ID866_4216 [Astraeus odoratus]